MEAQGRPAWERVSYVLDRHAPGRRLLRVGLIRTDDVNRSVTWRQRCKIEGMCHPAPCDAPNPFFAAVFVFVGASSKTPSVVRKLCGWRWHVA